MRAITVILTAIVMTGCSALYNVSEVRPVVGETSVVKVVPVTSQNVTMANAMTPYTPRSLPPVFDQTATLQSSAVPRISAYRPQKRPGSVQTNLPPLQEPKPYKIGVGDVVLLATPNADSSTLNQMNGLLAAQNSRQGYTVQDDGAIAIPTVGRVSIAGKTLKEAQSLLFQKLVESQIDPNFNLEITDFNSQRVAVGGAVGQPQLEPITLTPLYLDEAVTAAGGIVATDPEYATVRLYRDDKTYQVPATKLFAKKDIPRVLLQNGDRVFVDTEFSVELAENYMRQELDLAKFQRDVLDEQRDIFQTRLSMDAVDRDYVYVFGEVKNQGRWPLPFDRYASLADAMFEQGGIQPVTGNPRRIYLLRKDRDLSTGAMGITAWSLDAQNTANLLLATELQLRPNDIVFVASQPVTNWNRLISQILPSISIIGTANGILN
ncbi:polysaccharide biosynthesis/export family protein [Martelella radicis]|uniref:Polysaccharide export outer membrane protein n=1 Tax=Martelella radicis TaxID=1397476 RepID=A0A7W6KP32_9HYPH|nr:polysaccharide biosynthesis/export family protein [Martelella radicis]MBB4123368.1 polysaccharide export outer membrane protein [Martelella radicis]